MNSILDMEIGCYILETIFNENKYDLLDAYSILPGFVPANYIVSREAYLWV